MKGITDTEIATIEAAESIHRLLLEQEGATVDELATRLKLPRSRCYSALLRLIREQRVIQEAGRVKCEPYVYRAAPEGLGPAFDSNVDWGLVRSVFDAGRRMAA